METEWKATSNQFDNCTKKSRKRMDTIGSDHHAKLDGRKAETGVLPLFTFFHPIYLAFQAIYTSWLSARGTYKGATGAVKLLWDELSTTAIDDWDVLIQNVHRKSTPRYTELFPTGRKPFQSGSYESRLSAVRALIATIGDEAALRDIKTSIETFLARLVAARDLQQGKESLVDSLSAKVETERVKCAQGMYYTLGGLMQIYYKTPSEIAAFYDMESIRKTTSEEEEPQGGLVLTIAPGQTLEAGFTFTADTVFLFTNTGEVPLSVFTGGETPEPPASPFELKPAEEVEKPVTELGDPANRYLYIRNSNPDLAGSIEIITVVEEE